MARHLLCVWLVASWALAWCPAAQAAIPSEQLYPNTTVGYVSVPDVDSLREAWNQTDLGKMFDDPVMQPFVDDLNAQLRERLSQTGRKLGITWEDLKGVYGGEVSVAAIQPDRDPKAHALALIVDVTGKEAAANALLKKIIENQRAKGARISSKKFGDVNVTVIALVGDARRLATFAYYAILDNHLVVTDSEPVLAGILGQIKKKAPGALAELEQFQGAMGPVARAAGDRKPHLRWYVDPFGYAEFTRAMAATKRKRGTDALKVLRNQGFDAIQSVAGYVNFSTGDHEVLHRSFVYAPADPKATMGQKYRLAARMLSFPNEKTEAPPAWVPPEVGAYATLNWRMREAFDKYLGSLVDEFADDKIFDDVLESIKTDPHGPMVDLRKDLIAHLGERALIMTNVVEPIDVKSERIMVAVELTDPKAVEKTVNKAMSSDPDAVKREHNGHIIWEIVTEDEKDVAFKVEEIRIDGPAGFIGPGAAVAVVAAEEEDDGGEERVIPNSAITVAHGHLIVASHVDFIVKTLEAHDKALADAFDFGRVNKALDQLGGGEQAVRHFVRTEKAYHATYELVRQGKMPEAETVLGRVLNRILAPDDEEGAVRKQEIDGSKLPDYAQVRQYFGPAGVFATSEEAGWSVTGCLLKKDKEMKMEE